MSGCSCPRTTPELATHPESTTEGLCIFVLDSDPEPKICEKPDADPESLVIFVGSRSLHGPYTHIFSKSIAESRLHRWQPEFEQGSDSQL